MFTNNNNNLCVCGVIIRTILFKINLKIRIYSSLTFGLNYHTTLPN